ncbi:TIGR01459 family HAD hydrolase [Phytophthora nicotianae CJ01A1]|uniref:TIGR01459 family HAD hydrolase n=3 Tax=Phytophthora nicotianae TaxID=4792 RepID=W2G8F5_PHYNI|nr:TIGR01459 family HAD hydrolase [Phytophthora nicotianae]ETL32718.1 TIGR01459 family HAD hydrolase [Phytophthora nicotianae]ETL85986.1 TIGR01459 family HAD hydrolase [Phytophthora nicotianae]ETO67847.1 TIGR01459 family HAD hydrolase [Phytophthora nicotianae P1976]ETP09010.1 TIGR01459 family HAD hydrolase [Phytophthora nicotianae CJ01A1]
MTKIVKGLSQALAKYDVVLVDQYGVLHNGTQPMIGAVDCFNRMIEAGKRVVLVSNTANRSSGLLTKLGAMGFSTDFLGVTGGDVCHEYIRERLSTHTRCSVMAHDLDKMVSKTNMESILNGLDVEIVGLEKAQFLMVEGVQQVCYSDKVHDAMATDYRHTNTPNDAINEFLRGGLERKLPLLCPNSDAVGVVENDRFVYMGGGIAKLYEQMGGEVVYFGKPTKEHFEVCLRLANVTDKSKVVHIGDSLHHDVQGAKNIGVDSIFIAGGVHAKQLEVDAWSDAEEDLCIKAELLDRLLAETQLDPTYTATRFQW